MLIGGLGSRQHNQSKPHHYQHGNIEGLLWSNFPGFSRTFPKVFCPNACSASYLGFPLDPHNPVDLVCEALELPLVGHDDDLGVRYLVEYLTHLPQLLLAEAVVGSSSIKELGPASANFAPFG